jgi:hypothetical protein
MSVHLTKASSITLFIIGFDIIIHTCCNAFSFISTPVPAVIAIIGIEHLILIF